MKEIRRKINLNRFLLANKREILKLNKIHVNLFNAVGKKYSDGGLQLAFTGSIILAFLKGIKVPKKEKINLLKNALKLVEKGEA